MRGKINKIVMTMLLVFCMSISISAVNVHAEDSDSTVKADNHEKVWKEYDAERAAEYLTGDNTYPKLEGYLFSGWYTTNEIPTDDNAALEFVIKDSVPDGATTVYALFVPEHMLSVKAQVSSHLIDSNVTSDDDTASIRFVTTVDSLLYQQVGFEVSYVDDNGNTKTATSASNKVYERLFAQGSTSDVWSVTPQGLFCGVAKYFKACTVTGVPTNNYSTKFTVKPYWITMDGAKVYGVTATKAIEDGCLRDDVYVSENGQNVPYLGYSSDKPYATLNYALAHVNDGGTVHITDNVEVGTWEEHGKNVTITGGKLTVTANDFCINDGVTFKSLELIMPDTDRDINRIFAEGHDLIIESSVTVTNTEATFQIFGGSMTKEVASTNMKLYAGSYNAIFGGGCNTSTNVLGDVSVTVGGKVNENVGTTYTDSKTTTYQMFGGGYKGVVYGDVKIVVEEGALFNYIYGGMCSESGDTISKVNGAINIEFAGKAYGIYCGSYYGTNGNTCLNMTGGEAYQIFGGNRFTDMEGNTDIQITKGTVHRRIFGGSYNNWSLTWESPSRHVTGYTSVTIGEDATLNLNQGDEYGLVAGSRSGSTFDDETGVLIFNDNTYSTHEKKIGSSAFSSMKKYHYLVKSSTGGKVYSVGNCIQIEPTSGNTAVVTVKKSDGTEEVVYYTEDTKSYYPLPDLSSYTGEVIVTFSTGKVTDFSGYAASIGTSYYKTLEEAIAAAEKDENAVITELTTTKQLASITIADSENGIVTADKMNCVTGDKVTLTVTPDEGYELAELIVKKDGTEVADSAITVDGNAYSLVAEVGEYTVEAEFALKTADVTITINSKSDNMSFEGVTLTFALKRDSSIWYRGIVNADSQIVLSDVILGTYEIATIDFFGGELNFADIVISEDTAELQIEHKEGIGDTVDSTAVKVDVANSSVSINNCESSTSSNIFLQGQKLTGDVWFGMKVHMSADDLNATDYRNIGINIYKNGSNRIQLVSLGSGRVALKYDNSNQKELSTDMAQALTAGGILMAGHRTIDGKLEVYAGVHSKEMTKLFTVDSPLMGTDTLDQFGLDMQGPISSANIWHLTSGTAKEEALSGLDCENQNVTVTINSKSNNTVMSFENVELTFTLKRDENISRTVTVDANNKVVLADIPNGTYAISSVDFFGSTLSFADILIWEGRTEVEIKHVEGVNDNINNAAVNVNVATSSVSINNLTSGKGYFFLQDQALSGEQWFGTKVKMSATDLEATDWRNFGIQIFGNNSADYIQVLDHTGEGRVVVKYDNSNQKELSSDMVKALNAGDLLLAVCRTEDGKLEVYVGVHSDSNEMTRLFTVASPKVGTADIEQFGPQINGPITEGSLQSLRNGKTMADVLSGLDGNNQDVTVNITGKSERMSFENVQLTFTLKRDESISRTVTVDSNGQVVLEDIPDGTYSVSNISFLGGTLTFADILIWEGRTTVEITHNESITDTITDATAVSVDVATSSVNFKDSSISSRNNGKFYLTNGTALQGDVWFGMKVKMSQETLDANLTSSQKDNFIGFLIWEDGKTPGDYWNMIQVETAASDLGTNVNYNNNHHGVLAEEYLNALTREGMYLAVNRKIEDGKTYLKFYVGTDANNMVYLTETSDEKSKATPNVGQADMDEFGIITQGAITNASIENITSGTKMEEVLGQDITIKVNSKSERMSFENTQLTFTSKGDASVTYTGTIDANGEIHVENMLLGTYTVSSVDFFGGTLTFPDVIIQRGITEVEITQQQGINDKVGAASAQINVANSSVAFVNSTASTSRSDGYFFLQGQELKGDVWFGMKVKMSPEDLSASGNPFVALCIYENNWNLIQVMSVGNGTAVVKFNYNNSTYKVLDTELTEALTGDGMLLVVNRATDGTVRIYGGTKTNEMVLLVTYDVSLTNMKTADLDQFGFMTQGKITDASIENITSGSSMDELGFELAKENVTVNVTGKSERMSFKDVQLTFTLKSDTSVQYVGTADADGKMVLNDMLLGTYSVSDIDFLGGTLTFPDVVVEKGTTEVSIEHNEGITDTITDKTAVSVDVATSSVNFNGSNVDWRDRGKFYLTNGTAFQGDVWFGMKVKMSEETLANASSTINDNFIGMMINENGWNMIQIETNNVKDSRTANVNYNNNHHGILADEYLSALTGDGLYVAFNRIIKDGKTYMEIYVGADANSMVYLTETNSDKASAPPNVGQADIDEFGIITQGVITNASIENIKSGLSIDAIGFQLKAE